MKDQQKLSGIFATHNNQTHNTKIYITGIGIISAIGRNVLETINSLTSLRSGIGNIEILKTNHRGKIPVAEFKFRDEELFAPLGLEPCEGFTRTALFGMIAAKEATETAKIKVSQESRTGLVSATTVGGMCKSELYYNDYLNNDTRNAYINTHDCGDATEKIADFLGIRDFVTTISTACSSSANSIIYGARLIKNGIVDRVIAGGTDSLSKFTINGFNTLMILDKNVCHPFDNKRAGLTIGEGAAFLILESENMVKNSGKAVLAELSGFGNANDAFHQTSSSPDGAGAYLAMNQALSASGLSPKEISYINAHGTGTENNDLSEGLAIERLFGKEPPFISSTKPFTGHTLGACGAIEAVISILAIQYGIIFPNLNFSDRMKELSFSPVTQLIKNQQVNHVLSNSFGFGGNNTSLIFSKV